MKIAIASGKGGTGKTTVAVNLALSLRDVQLFDCDVEEPNCNLFLGLDLEKVEDVLCLFPVIDSDKCTLCGQCADFCRFNALASLPLRVMVFPSLCHGCGGCRLVCPAEAVREESRSLGILEKGISSNSPDFYRGLLNVGEGMATPVIRALQRHIDPGRHVIIDSPPGVACPVLAAVGNADYCVLVTESTPFGFHDFKLAMEAVKVMNIPFGVVINREGLGDSRVEEFCRAEKVPVLLKIPNDRKIARLYSEGVPFVEDMPGWKGKFADMLGAIESEVIKSEVIKSEAIEPEAIESEAIEPEAIEPETIEPEAVEPEAIEPETIEPEAIEPEAIEPEAIEPEAIEPEVDRGTVKP